MIVCHEILNNTQKIQKIYVIRLLNLKTIWQTIKLGWIANIS